MPRPDFRDFLARSLDLLAEEVPPAYARLAERLAPLVVRLDVDGQASVLAFRDGRHEFRDDTPHQALLRTTRKAILDLVDGGSTLLEALRRETLWLQGRPESVVRLDEALRAFLAGAVRAPSFPILLDDYRQRGASRTPAAKE